MYVAVVTSITKGGKKILYVDIIQIRRQDPSLPNTIVCQLNGSKKELAHLTRKCYFCVVCILENVHESSCVKLYNSFL